MAEDTDGLLRVDTLVAGYGKKRVLNGVSLEVTPGEIVALIGHNGAGKSTLLKTLFGMLPVWAGSIELDGKRLGVFSPRELLRAGVAYVPQGNRVFSDLTVGENLEMGGVTLSDRAGLREGMDRVFGLFPALKPHLRQPARTLSGGEKQMLALANVLILSPRLLFLDEPSLGLAPRLVNEALAAYPADQSRFRVCCAHCRAEGARDSEDFSACIRPAERPSLLRGAGGGSRR